MRCQLVAGNISVAEAKLGEHNLGKVRKASKSL